MLTRLKDHSLSRPSGQLLSLPTIHNRLCKCLRCGHKWVSIVEQPRKCPACTSRKWAVPPTIRDLALAAAKRARRRRLLNQAGNEYASLDRWKRSCSCEQAGNPMHCCECRRSICMQCAAQVAAITLACHRAKHRTGVGQTRDNRASMSGRSFLKLYNSARPKSQQIEPRQHA